MAVMLDVTGDLVLTGQDSFSTLTVDRQGQLGLEHAELRNIITRVAKAINQQHEQVTGLQTEIDQLHGELHAMRMQTSSVDGRLGETEDIAREVKIKIERMSEEIAEITSTQGQEVVSKEDLDELHERCDRLIKQLEAQDHRFRDDVDGTKDLIRDLDDKVTQQQSFLDNDVESRFSENDDALLSQKMELESLQSTVADMHRRKANRSELNEMEKVIDFIREEQKSDNATLKEAHQNLQKLDDCVSLAYENKAQTENLWRIFRDETSEIRDWASKGFSEVRIDIRAKMEEAYALSAIEELKREVRKDKMYFTQATSRVEDGIKHKAEAGDVVRLKDAVQEFRELTKKPKQLLVGTKCLACNRPATEDMTLDGAVDSARERQRDELYHEVQKVLSKSSSGNDVIKYVAVHVGSPTRAYASGSGPFEARNVTDPTPGSHYLAPATPRASNAPNRPAPDTGVPRAPPREVPPLARVGARRLEGPQPPRGPPSARRMHSGYMSMRDALAPQPPSSARRRASSPSGSVGEALQDSGVAVHVSAPV